MKMTVIPTVIGVLRTITKILAQGLKELEPQRTSRDHPNNGIINISQNTEKSSGDLRIFTVT